MRRAAILLFAAGAVIGGAGVVLPFVLPRPEAERWYELMLAIGVALSLGAALALRMFVGRRLP
jgi:hypothetical protein